MDERLERALKFANYRKTLANQKQNILERMRVLQTVHYNRGLFDANSTTISFVKTFVDLGKTSTIVVDKKENLITIDDLQDFLETLVSAYVESVNECKPQLEKIEKSRSIKKLMDW